MTMTEFRADDSVHLAFVCVQNAGRSQMASAFAERERDRRGLADRVVIHSGGTHPADDVHPIVVVAMDEVGIDVGDRTPQSIDEDTLAGCDVIATMGCSTLSLDGVDVRDWDLPDPYGEEIATVREIRETIADRVSALFDELDVDHRDE